MNQRLQLHNTAYFLAEIPNFCKSCCVHVHWFSGFIYIALSLIIGATC